MQYDDLRELTVLDALDLLDEDERRILAENLYEFPELETELMALEDTVAAIAYSAPLVPMAADLKDRLFTQITHAPLIVRSHQVNWQPYSVPGVTVGILHIDDEKREITALVRLEPGLEYPLHQHAGIEEVFMLEGDLVAGGQICYQGDYIRSFPQSTHAPITHEGCLLLVRSSLDDEILVSAVSDR
jgi:anti-sigma factor ChrR (cupin superfamily)